MFDKFFDLLYVVIGIEEGFAATVFLHELIKYGEVTFIVAIGEEVSDGKNYDADGDIDEKKDDAGAEKVCEGIICGEGVNRGGAGCRIRCRFLRKSRERIGEKGEKQRRIENGLGEGRYGGIGICGVFHGVRMVERLGTVIWGRWWGS